MIRLIAIANGFDLRIEGGGHLCHGFPSERVGLCLVYAPGACITISQLPVLPQVGVSSRAASAPNDCERLRDDCGVRRIAAAIKREVRHVPNHAYRASWVIFLYEHARRA